MNSPAAFAADPAAEPILRAGDTCWRIERANRLSFIVDAADYFAAAKDAIAAAKRVVYLIGWDFDLRIRLKPEEENPALPDQLRKFLTHVVGEQEELEIFILQWDGAMLFNIARQILPFLALNIRRKPQVHFRLDSEHPAGACHHQKIVVVDDSIAFCGGIDMTEGRWDTRGHRAEDRRRRDPNSRGYEPWHDMTTAVDGDAARALGELARNRWKRATGEDLPVPEAGADAWPESLPVSCRDVDVAIARTMPAHGGGDGDDDTNEIERLLLAAISAAKRTIYIENQYLAAGSIAEALVARLVEPDGPEIVVVVPKLSETWLESKVMDGARARIVQRLREADRHGRFAIYYPMNGDGEPVYVHAKVLIVDDRLVRVGSSNISNRSLHLDSECDLAIEAREDDPELSRTIERLRNSLVAEHVGMRRDAFEARLAAAGAFIRAIESSRGDSARDGDGKTLCPLQVHPLDPAEAALVDSQLFNPERPRRPENPIKNFVKRLVSPYQTEAVLAGAAIGAWLVLRQFRTPPPSQRR